MERIRAGLKPEVVIAAAGLLIIGLVSFTMYSTQAALERALPLHRAGERTALQITLAQVAFSDALRGEPVDLEQDVYARIDQAAQLVAAVRTGGDTVEGRLNPSDEEELGHGSTVLEAQIGDFRSLTTTLWNERGANNATDLKKTYDALFTAILANNAANSAFIEQLVLRDRDRLWRYSWATILFVLAMFIGLALMLVRNRRASESLNTELERKIQDRTAELANERNLLRTLIDNVPDLIYAKDLNSNFILANQSIASLMGAGVPSKLLGKNDFDFYPAEVAREFRADEVALLENESPLIGKEESYKTADGKLGWLSTTKVPLRNAQGELVGLVGVGRDITVARAKDELIKEREEQYRRIVETANEGIMMTNAGNNIIYVNPRGAKIFGYEQGEMIGRSPADDLLPSEKEVAKARLENRRQGRTTNSEVGIQRKDGAAVWLYSSAQPILNDENEYTGTLYMFTDITQRRAAEKALAYERDLLQALMDNIPDLIFFKDRESRFVRSNAAHLRNLGVNDLSDVLGKTDLDFHDNQAARAFIADEQKIMETGVPILNQLEANPAPDGSPRWFSTTKVPWRDQAGNIVGTLGVAHDVTELKRKDAALEASEALYRSLVEVLPQSMFRKDREGRFIFGNSRYWEALGRPAEEVLGKTDYDFFPAELADKYRRDDLMVMKRGESVEVVEEHLTPDGEPQIIRTNKSPIRDEKGDVVGVQVMFWDITEGRRQHEQIRKLSSAVEQSPSSIVITDKVGSIEYVNPTFSHVTGYSPNEVLGKNLRILKSGHTTPDEYRRLWETITAGQIWRGEFLNLKKNGELYWELASISPIMNEEGNLTHFVAVLEDITERKRKDEQLREREEQFRKLFEASPDAILLVDPHGPGGAWLIVDCNEVACLMNGYTRKELVGQPIDILNSESDPPEARAMYLETVRESGVLHVEAAHRHKDGHIFPIDVSTSLITVGGRELVLGIDRDITERKRVEQALREGERMLAKAQQIAHVGSWRRQPGVDSVSWSEEMYRIFGIDPADNTLTTTGILEKAIHPEDRAKVLAASERMWHDGIPGPFEYRLVRPDGQERTVWAEGEVVRDRLGNTTGVVGVVQDITERKRAEQELTRQKELLQAVFDNIPVMIGVFDRSGHYTVINHEWNRALGYSLDEMNGGDVMTSLYPDPDERLNARNFMFSPSAGWRDFHTIVHGGYAIDTSWAYAPLSDGLTIAFGQDITKRKEVDRLKNEFISTVSHELRTPLTSIRGSLGLIAGGVAGPIPERVRSMIEIAHKNSERLVRLINDILDIEKIESGKMAFNFKRIELMPLIEQAIEANRGYGEQFGVTAVIAESVPGIQINADWDRMTQVITNLLSNAAKFSPPKSQVAIRVSRIQNYVRLAVHDQGPGISDEFKSRIFQKFAQADSSDSRQKGGTGLGLSIVKAIVEKHNGTVAFDSEAGGGTTFFVELPEWREPLAAGQSESPEARVLVIEDDPDVALLLSLMLKQSGFPSDVAYDAASAKELLRQHTYAALTLDLMLPDRDGIGLIRELRAEEATRDLPLIVVSAKAEQGRQQLNGDAIWVAEWLQKPIDHMALVRAVKDAALHLRKGKPHILHVEDDRDVLQVVRAILHDTADVTSAPTLSRARELLEQDEYDLVIIDPSLPDGSGTALLPLLPRNNGQIPVVIFSAHDDDQVARDPVSAALVKSRTSNEQFLETITQLIQPRRVESEPARVVSTDD